MNTATQELYGSCPVCGCTTVNGRCTNCERPAATLEPTPEPKPCPYCPRCGQLYAVHNGDGSCVHDEPYVPTKVLHAHPGVEVVAKRYRGELYAAAYSNRTQAERKAARLGSGWAVYHWGRPFFVGREVQL